MMTLHLVPPVEDFDSREEHGSLDVQDERVHLFLGVVCYHIMVVRPLTLLGRNKDLHRMEAL